MVMFPPCHGQVGKDLGPDDLKEAARIDQWHALNTQVQAEQAAMAEPVRAARPPRNQLSADGRGCIELLVNSLSALLPLPRFHVSTHTSVGDQ